MNKVKRVIGPKGQVVIPKEIRDKIELREGVEVVVELRGDEVVIRRATPPTKSYVDYFIRTYSEKLRHEIDIKKLLEEEMVERTGLHRL